MNHKDDRISERTRHSSFLNIVSCFLYLVFLISFYIICRKLPVLRGVCLAPLLGAFALFVLLCVLYPLEKKFYRPRIRTYTFIIVSLCSIAYASFLSFSEQRRTGRGKSLHPGKALTTAALAMTVPSGLKSTLIVTENPQNFFDDEEASKQVLRLSSGGIHFLPSSMSVPDQLKFNLILLDCGDGNCSSGLPNYNVKSLFRYSRALNEHNGVLGVLLPESKSATDSIYGSLSFVFSHVSCLSVDETRILFASNRKDLPVLDLEEIDRRFDYLNETVHGSLPENIIYVAFADKWKEIELDSSKLAPTTASNPVLLRATAKDIFPQLNSFFCFLEKYGFYCMIGLIFIYGLIRYFISWYPRNQSSIQSLETMYLFTLVQLLVSFQLFLYCQEIHVGSYSVHPPIILPSCTAFLLIMGRKNEVSMEQMERRKRFRFTLLVTILLGIILTIEFSERLELFTIFTSVFIAVPLFLFAQNNSRAPISHIKNSPPCISVALLGAVLAMSTWQLCLFIPYGTQLVFLIMIAMLFLTMFKRSRSVKKT